MQQTVAIGQPDPTPAVPLAELAARMRALKLTPRALAAAADLHRATVYRAIKHKDCRLTTATRLTAALIDIERQELARLVRLHGEAA